MESEREGLQVIDYKDMRDETSARRDANTARWL